MCDNQTKIIMENWNSYLQEINPYFDEKGHFTSKDKAKIYSLTKRAKKHLAKDSDVEIPARGQVTSSGKIKSKFGMNTGSPDKQCGRLTIDGEKKKKTRSCKDYPENYTEQTLNEPQMPPEGTLEKSMDLESEKPTESPRKRIRIKIAKKKQELEEKDETERKPDPMREKDKIFPGYADLKRLSRGIFESQEVQLTLKELVAALVSFLKENPSQKSNIESQLNQIGFYSSSQLKSKCQELGRYSLGDWLEIQNRQALANKGELNKPPKAK